MMLLHSARRAAAAAVALPRAAWGRQTVAARRALSTGRSRAAGAAVTMHFHEGGETTTISAPVGETVLDVALENGIDIEGACGGELACSTCHVILPQEYYDQLPEKSEEEEDMLDLAWGLTDTSRLCCQVVVTPELEGMNVSVPEETNNQMEDNA